MRRMRGEVKLLHRKCERANTDINSYKSPQITQRIMHSGGRTR